MNSYGIGRDFARAGHATLRRLRARAVPGGAALLLLGVAAMTLAAAAAGSGYHMLKKYALGGEGGWDYINYEAATHRLFISRSTHVVVLDTDSGKPVGDIPNTAGVHGIALAPELGRGFTSNGVANAVTIFDLKTLAVIGTAATGTGPDAIVSTHPRGASSR
jgi:hypothetical protein